MRIAQREPLTVVIVVLMVMGGVVSGYLYGVNSAVGRSTSTMVVPSTVLSTVTYTITVIESNVLLNGGFESGLTGWEVLAGSGLLDNTTSLPRTIVLTQNNPRSGAYALEFATRPRQGPSNSPYCTVPGNATTCNYTTLLQHVPKLTGQQGDCVSGPTRFGVSVRPGLALSLWYRTANSTSDNFEIGATFHNGSSKIAIDYLLSWKGEVPLTTVTKGPPGGLQGGATVLLNNSGPDWRQARFDLYHDFVKYFGVDPVANHYCVNYIALNQYNANNNPLGNYVYCYFDDVELDEPTQSFM